MARVMSRFMVRVFSRMRTRARAEFFFQEWATPVTRRRPFSNFRLLEDTRLARVFSLAANWLLAPLRADLAAAAAPRRAARCPATTTCWARVAALIFLCRRWVALVR